MLMSTKWYISHLNSWDWFAPCASFTLTINAICSTRKYFLFIFFYLSFLFFCVFSNHLISCDSNVIFTILSNKNNLLVEKKNQRIRHYLITLLSTCTATFPLLPIQDTQFSFIVHTTNRKSPKFKWDKIKIKYLYLKMWTNKEFSNFFKPTFNQANKYLLPSLSLSICVMCKLCATNYYRGHQ